MLRKQPPLSIQSVQPVDLTLSRHLSHAESQYPVTFRGDGYLSTPQRVTCDPCLNLEFPGAIRRLIVIPDTRPYLAKETRSCGTLTWHTEVMEAMRRLDDNSLDTVIYASAEAFLPILKTRKALIASTPKKTFKYGSTERHKLDIYYPPHGTKPAPILFFVYGGGFTTGARDLFPDLVYDNVGAFFAQRGILTIIPDYRLAPQTVYPGPVHDLREAVQFALYSRKVNVFGNGGDKSRVYIMGHSAGCAHTVSLLLNEDVMSVEEREMFRGAVLSAGAHGCAPVIAGYYGEPKDKIDTKTPLGLLKSKSPDRLKELLPRLLFLLAENELPFLLEWDTDFKKTLGEKGFDDFQDYVMQGHNHISPNYALSSGEGEEWGVQVINWIFE